MYEYTFEYLRFDPHISLAPQKSVEIVVYADGEDAALRKAQRSVDPGPDVSVHHFALRKIIEMRDV